jgi:hypothetical protein
VLDELLVSQLLGRPRAGAEAGGAWPHPIARGSPAARAGARSGLRRVTVPFAAAVSTDKRRSAHRGRVSRPLVCGCLRPLCSIEAPRVRHRSPVHTTTASGSSVRSSRSSGGTARRRPRRSPRSAISRCELSQRLDAVACRRLGACATRSAIDSRPPRPVNASGSSIAALPGSQIRLRSGESTASIALQLWRGERRDAEAALVEPASDGGEGDGVVVADLHAVHGPKLDGAEFRGRRRRRARARVEGRSRR